MESKRNSLFIICISIVFVIFCLETGLQLRNFIQLKKKTIQLQSHHSSVKILFIGDSVFGDDTSTNTFAGQLKKRLQETFGPQATVISMAEPALSSWMALDRLKQVTEVYKPDITFIMLGNSDYVIYKDSLSTTHSKFVTWDQLFSHSVLYKLIKYKWGGFAKIDQTPNKDKRGQHKSPEMQSLSEVDKEVIQKCLSSFRKTDAIHFDQYWACLIKGYKIKDAASQIEETQIYNLMRYLDLNNEDRLSRATMDYIISRDKLSAVFLGSMFWQQTRQQKNLEALRIFEKYIQNYTPSRRISLHARFLYHVSNDIKKGQEVFKNLSERKDLDSINKNFFDQIYRTFAVRDETMKNLSYQNYKMANRDDYMGSLYQLKALNKPDEAQFIFSQIESVPFFSDDILDEESYLQIVQLLTKSESFVYALQYPNQPIWILDFLAQKNLAEVKIVNLHDSLMNQSKKVNVLNAFEDDFVHLSKQGAEVAVDAVMSDLKKNIKIKSP